MAPTLTATAQSTAHDGTPVSRVLLVLTWPGIQTALIERLDPDGTWRPVRGPNGDQIICYGSTAVFDHEAPLDASLTYRATSPQGSGAVNSNIYFESDASPWTAIGGTVARSTAQAHQGAASLLLTPDGTSSSNEARSENVAATVGATYAASAWLRCAVARVVNLGLIWRDSGGALLSSTLQPVSLAANTWTWAQVTGVAPASTAQAQFAATMGSTPPSSNLLSLDEAMLVSPAALTVTSNAVTVPSGGSAWLSHPGHPQYAASTTVTDIQAAYAGRAGTFWAIGAAVPIAVVDVRGGGEGTVVWQTKTVADYQRIRSLIADGGVLLMRLPATWDGDSWWIMPGDIAEVRLTNRPTDGWRRYQMPFTRVDRPAGPSDGAVGQTWDDVKATYATWSAVVATGKTWSALEAQVS